MVGSILSYLGPTPPDFDFCDDFYGTPLLAHCGQVLELMPRGTNPVLYNNEPITADTGSPFRIGAFYDTGTGGTCRITLNFGGPSSWLIPSIPIIPDTIHGMASWLVDQCVHTAGIGGYVTQNISNTVDYITDVRTNLAEDYPTNTTFVTVAVKSYTAEGFLDVPGDHHPFTGSVLTQILMGKWLEAGDEGDEGGGPSSPDYKYFVDATRRFSKSTLSMIRGGFQPWWQENLFGR